MFHNHKNYDEPNNYLERNILECAVERTHWSEGIKIDDDQKELK